MTSKVIVCLPVAENDMYTSPWYWTSETAFKLGRVDRVMPRIDTWSADTRRCIDQELEYVDTLVCIHLTSPVQFTSPLMTVLDELHQQHMIMNQSGILLHMSTTESHSGDMQSNIAQASHVQPNIAQASHVQVGWMTFGRPAFYSITMPDPQWTVATNLVHPLVEQLVQRPIISVITATIGCPHLDRCMDSISKQTYIGIMHWVVIDGVQYTDRLNEFRIKHQFTSNHKFLALWTNTGTVDGRVVYFGHRIYAGMTFMVNTPFISFMDDDNMCSSDHYTSMMDTYTSTKLAHPSVQLDGVYSFRSIIEEHHSTFICNDEYESLGALSSAPGYSLCDTSTYLLTLDAAIRCAPSWYSSEGDRGILASCTYKNHCSLVPTYKHTLQYRLRETKLSRTFFTSHSLIDASKPRMWIFHYNYDATVNALESMYGYRIPSPLGDWQPYMLNGLGRYVQLFNGFRSATTKTLHHIPYGSHVLVHLCNPRDIPIDALKERPDLHIVTFTVESPNIRHHEQWDIAYLSTFSNALLTYWSPMLDTPTSGTTPHAHPHYGVSNDRVSRVGKDDVPTYPCYTYGRFFATRQQLVDTCIPDNWRDRPNRAVMVLANRKYASMYTVNGVQLESMDALREVLVHAVSTILPVDAVGEGWVDVPNGLVTRYTSRMQDTHTPVDYYKQYRYVLIVENCNADGYMSEKLQDAWIAGTIPIYIGNHNYMERDDIQTAESMMVRVSRDQLYDLDVLETCFTYERAMTVLSNIHTHRERILSKYCSPMTYANYVFNAVYNNP